MEPKGRINFRMIWGIFMVVIYISLAYAMIFMDIFTISKNLRIIVGVLFFLYGVFRGISVWKYGK
jgi:hypothetical protein